MCYDRSNSARTQSHETRDRYTHVLVAQIEAAGQLSGSEDFKATVQDAIADAVTKLEANDLGSINTMKVYSALSAFYGQSGLYTDAAAALASGIKALKAAVPTPAAPPSDSPVKEVADRGTGVDF
jgi:hypothetical protein